MTVTSEEAFKEEMSRLAKYFEEQNLGEREDPCSIMDKHGRILVWHLPDILAHDRVVISELS
jgi:hypothetical protein